MAVSATRWIEVTIWSMEAEVSATLEACTCVFFTTFCTLMLISCIVLVTSSMAEEACTLTFADSSAAPATWLEPAETWPAESRVVRTRSCKPVRHAKEGVAESVALGARHNFHGQVAFGDGHGDAGHFLEVGDHIVEGSRQRADFVVAVNVDVLIEIAGIANFAGDGNEVSERLGDRFCGVVGDADADQQSEECRRW